MSNKYEFNVNKWVWKITDKLIMNITEAQQKTCKLICDEAKANAPVRDEAKANTPVRDEAKANTPVRTRTYADSFQVGETVTQDNIICTTVFNDVKVGGATKWANVPLGCLLEWGTGIKGQNTNTYNHGYPYRQTAWVYYDPYYKQWFTTKGMVARPHLLPSLNNNKARYRKYLREALRKTRHG